MYVTINTMARLDFVKRHNIHRLYVILELCNILLQEVYADLKRRLETTEIMNMQTFTKVER